MELNRGTWDHKKLTTMRVAQKTVNPERLSKDATAIRGINNMLETVSDDMIIDSDKHFD